ncbi:MAG: hypothetical protein MI924_04110 [Chloroflexales bacterium]|nr:hypothetical protein [Chloroflexales bacterium]
MLRHPQLSLHPEVAVCTNPACGARDRLSVHTRVEQRYKCQTCGKTRAETCGTPLYGRKRPLWVVRLVFSLLAAGCPRPAIVFACGLDAWTVANWQHKADHHATCGQEQVVCQDQVDGGQGQGDDLAVRLQGGTRGMATAMRVFSRLFRWDAITPHRDARLVTPGIRQGRAAAQAGRPILWAVDGVRAWTSGVLRVFRDPLHPGRCGRLRHTVWADLHVGQVVKQYAARRVVGVPDGCTRCAAALMQAAQITLGVSNTAYVERRNATLRTWLPALPAGRVRQRGRWGSSKRRCSGWALSTTSVGYMRPSRARQRWRPT